MVPSMTRVQRTWQDDGANRPNYTRGSALEALQIIKHARHKLTEI